MADIISSIAALPGQVWGAISGAGRRLGQVMQTAASAVVGNGKPVWPPASAEPRLRRYEQYGALYAGKQQRYFDTRFKRENRQKPYLCVNLLGGATDLLATRAYGEGFDAQGPSDDADTQEFLERVIAENRLQWAAYEEAIRGLYGGDKCFKVTYDAESASLHVQAVNPAVVFPEWDPLDSRRLVAANIDQLLKVGGDERNAWLWRERHELRDGHGWVVNKLYRLDHTGTGDGITYHFSETEDERDLTTLPELAGLVPEADTGIDALLVVFQPGESFYSESLLSLQGEYNHRVTQKSDLFDRHLAPSIFFPSLDPSVVDENGKVDMSKVRYFELAPGETSTATLLEWSASGFAQADEHLKRILEGFAFSAGIDTAALLADQAQAAASGTALRRQQMKTQGTVQALQRHDEPLWQALLSVCTKLGAVQPLAEDMPKPVALQPGQITVAYQDGLPSDRTEDVTEAVTLVGAGIMSKADASKALFGGTDEDAQKRVQEAQAEQQASRPQSPFGAATAQPGAGSGRFTALTPGG